jgi:hypothetical protein
MQPCCLDRTHELYELQSYRTAIYAEDGILVVHAHSYTSYRMDVNEPAR